MRIFGTYLRDVTPLVWSTMLTAFLIPCFRRIVALGIGLMIVTSVAEAMKHARKLSLRLNPTAWLMLLFFVVHFIGLNFAQDVDQGFKEIEIKLSYFVFPLILFFGFEIKRRLKFLIAFAFVLGCMLRIPISIAQAWTVYHETQSAKAFSYEMLSAPYHPSYMALYQGCSLLLMLSYFYNCKPNKKRQIVLLFALTFTLIYISMLASRAGLISAVLFIVFAALAFWKEADNRLERTFLTGGCLVVLTASSILLPATATRIEALQIQPSIPKAETTKAPTTSSMELRQITWAAAWHILLENPFGVGTANTEKALVDEYMRREETTAAEKALNAHNQWLQMAAEFGWLGLAMTFAFFALLLLSAYRQSKWLMVIMAFVFMLNCIVESMMEVQAGIVFIALLTILIGPAAPARSKSQNFAKL